jgi:hypothetical protein
VVRRETRVIPGNRGTISTRPAIDLARVIKSSMKEIKKGFFSEYLDRGMNLDQITAERKQQLQRISDIPGGRVILAYAADLNKASVPPIGIDNGDLIPINDQISVLEGDKLDLILETSGGIGVLFVELFSY